MITEAGGVEDTAVEEGEGTVVEEEEEEEATVVEEEATEEVMTIGGVGTEEEGVGVVEEEEVEEASAVGGCLRASTLSSAGVRRPRTLSRSRSARGSSPHGTSSLLDSRTTLPSRPR